jgi:hypothetical protein
MSYYTHTRRKDCGSKEINVLSELAKQVASIPKPIGKKMADETAAIGDKLSLQTTLDGIF